MIEKHLLISPSGEISWIDLERKPNYGPVYNGDLALDLHQIYSVIGCSCVEQVRTVLSNIVLVIDESGKCKNPSQPHNELASQLYCGYQVGMDDICGPAIVMRLRRSGPYGEEDWFPLDPADLAKLSLFLGVKLPDK